MNQWVNNCLHKPLFHSFALFAIKVWDEAAKSIQYAVANGYVPEAKKGASQAKRKLPECICVTFIQPGTHGGYRIIITLGDYEIVSPKH